MKAYKTTGKALTVKDWFGKKKVSELGIGGCFWFRIFSIVKESEKAVYALVDFGAGTGFRTFWIPKSCLTEYEFVLDEAYHWETIRADYDTSKALLLDEYAAVR